MLLLELLTAWVSNQLRLCMKIVTVKYGWVQTAAEWICLILKKRRFRDIDRRRRWRSSPLCLITIRSCCCLCLESDFVVLTRIQVNAGNSRWIGETSGTIFFCVEMRFACTVWMMIVFVFWPIIICLCMTIGNVNLNLCMKTCCRIFRLLVSSWATRAISVHLPDFTFWIFRAKSYVRFFCPVRKLAR